MQRLIIGCVWLLALSPAPAPAAPEEKENLYEIEVLVFENRLPQYLGDELLAGEDGNLTPAALDKAVAVGAPPAGQSKLAGMAAALERDPHYRVLAHHRWLQAAEPKAAAKARRIPANAGARPGELDGTIRFYSSRFLHLDANLVFRQDGRNYRLNELRRMRIQDVHYFDHPRLSMLARVAPLDKEKPAR